MKIELKDWEFYIILLMFGMTLLVFYTLIRAMFHNYATVVLINTIGEAIIELIAVLIIIILGIVLIVDLAKKMRI